MLTDHHRATVPNFLSRFVGRAAEIAEIERLLADARLLTLTGAGGSGKTRLALEVARRVEKDYPDGVRVIELALVSDPALVPNAAATAFDIQEQPGRPVAESLASAIAPKAILLVLDNCEHLLSACAALAETLLRSCLRLRVLATSRFPLGLTGETLWRVPSLSLPGPGHAPARAAQLAQYDAIWLFVERARAAAPSFEVTERNARAVLNLCARLDGLPLAIELAAARVRVLTLEEIATRLDDRLLSTTNPAAPSRHRTLRAVTDWSVGLLTEPERAVFRRLAVFTGGWNVDAAEAVCQGGAVTGADVLAMLMQLVDKSLAWADTRGDETRFRLLETVRQYGLGLLAESGEETVTRCRHRDWYLRLAEEAEPRLYGPDQRVWLDRLEREHANLRGALEFSHSEQSGAEAELRLAGLLYWFWFLHHHWSEGRRHLERALARSADAPAPVLPRVLQGAMFFAWRQGDVDRAVALGTRGVKVSREQKDRGGEIRLLTWLAGTALQKGDHTGATTLAEDALGLARKLGDKWLISLTLGNVGNVARHRGDYARAVKYYDECLAVSREIQDAFRIAYSLRSIGHAALRQGYYERAGAAYKESLRSNQDKWVAEECFLGLAGVLCARRDYDRAARLLGMAEALRDALGHRLFPVDQADYERCVKTVREKLGELRFVAALEHGRAMRLDEAITFALAPSAVEPAARGRLGGLTSRELDVAGLIAQGLTNREIAGRLGTAPRTIDVHVAHILEKLRVKSRAQISAWVVENGLHLQRSGDISALPGGA